MAKKVIAEQHMVMERQTKGSVLYNAPNASPKLRNLYIPKNILPNPYPGDITVTVTVDNGEPAAA